MEWVDKVINTLLDQCRPQTLGLLKKLKSKIICLKFKVPGEASLEKIQDCVERCNEILVGDQETNQGGLFL